MALRQDNLDPRSPPAVGTDVSGPWNPTAVSPSLRRERASGIARVVWEGGG